MTEEASSSIVSSWALLYRALEAFFFLDSRKASLDAELKASRASYLEACLAWEEHPCTGHLYNMDLFKTQLLRTFERIRRTDLWDDLVRIRRPDPVYTSRRKVERGRPLTTSKIESLLRQSLVPLSRVILLAKEEGLLTSQALTPKAFDLLFQGLSRARGRLLEYGIPYPRGFSASCCTERDADDTVHRACSEVHRLSEL